MPGKFDQFGNLIAVGLRAASRAIDHGRADHDGANPFLDRGLSDIAVHVDARPPKGDGLKVAVLRQSYGTRIFSIGVIRDNGRARRMDQQLPAAFQRRYKSDDRARMIGACCVNDSVGCLRGFAQDLGIVQCADDGGDPSRFERRNLLLRPGQPRHLMARYDELFGNGAADITGRSGNEDFHSASP
jgi:hypothetical protein